MTITDRVRDFYKDNLSELNSYLEETSFFDVSTKYPNSVVIKFGKDKLIGELSVWQNSNTESYYECEYVDLTNLDKEPVNLNKQITGESVVEELTKQFNILHELVKVHLTLEFKAIIVSLEKRGACS